MAYLYLAFALDLHILNSIALLTHFTNIVDIKEKRLPFRNTEMHFLPLCGSKNREKPFHNNCH